MKRGANPGPLEDQKREAVWMMCSKEWNFQEEDKFGIMVAKRVY